jgi:Sulfotransferase family
MLGMAPIDRLFLGVGAMKAGTTWLYSVLDRHPDIYFSDEKEVHYFAHVHGILEALTLANRLGQFRQFCSVVREEKYNARWMRRRLNWYSRWLNEPVDDRWYADLFADKRDEKYVADFSNLTALLGDEGWQHVHRVAGEVRVLYIMRKPLDRLWSHVRFHAQFVGKASELPNWGVAEYEDFARKKHIWQNAEYGHIVATLKRNFNDEELMIAFFEDIHADPAAFLRNLEKFLGVPPSIYPELRLTEKINRSPEVEMPEIFPQIFTGDFDRICEELVDIGVVVPDTWAPG